ncbi:MAG: hypothetical protein VX778_02225, partial [Candidatus Thermoplasmatota archaeon]|nr:hypothetical protein [Candidatus Thermoplasmatota archaeon]
LPMDSIVQSVRDVLDEIADELRARSTQHMENVIQPLPEFTENDGTWTMNCEIKEGHIFVLPLVVSVAIAEIIARTTGLTFLGDSTDDFSEERPCHMSGKPTKRRVLLAKTY